MIDWLNRHPLVVVAIIIAIIFMRVWTNENNQGRGR